MDSSKWGNSGGSAIRYLLPFREHNQNSWLGIIQRRPSKERASGDRSCGWSPTTLVSFVLWSRPTRRSPVGWLTSTVPRPHIPSANSHSASRLPNHLFVLLSPFLGLSFVEGICSYDLYSERDSGAGVNAFAGIFDLPACKSECEATPGCTGFVYKPMTNQCW